MRLRGASATCVSATCVVLLSWLLAVPTAATQGQAIPDLFAKQRELSAVSGRKGLLIVADVELISRGLTDTDPSVRRFALRTVGSRLNPMRFGYAELRQAYVADHALLDQLSPRVLDRLTDPDSQVRGSAVEAAAYQHFESSDTNWPPTKTFDVGPVLTERLVRMYSSESSEYVRGEIVRILSGTGADVPEPSRSQISGLILHALDDPAASAVQPALWEVSKRQIASGLPKAVQLLRNPDYKIRMVSAQVVASFGPAARQYLPDLRKALEVETDDITKKTIQGAINAISR